MCRDLGVSKSALQTWVKDDRFRALGFTPTTDVEERREMTAAMQRIRELEMENEVLRRAAAYLSQANLRTPNDVPARPRDGRLERPATGGGGVPGPGLL